MPCYWSHLSINLLLDNSILVFDYPSRFGGPDHVSERLNRNLHFYDIHGAPRQKGKQTACLSNMQTDWQTDRKAGWLDRS